MINSQPSVVVALPEGERDTRLLTALHLLQKPERQPASPYLPLLASSGLAGAALLLAYTMIIGPVRQDAPSTEASVTSPPTFEISGSPQTQGSHQIKAQSITPPVKEAVLVGTEASR